MRCAPIARTVLIVLTGTLALFITGCISIKSGQTVVTQRAPGVVRLGATLCVTDRDQNHYPDCNPSNVQASDNGLDGDELGAQSGQLLVAFRVPDGVTHPTSFPSDTQDTTFIFSNSYTNGLNAMFTPVPGMHWVGYRSGFKNDIDPASDPDDRTFSLHAEFGLPTAPDGGPFPGPLKYRIAAGLRGLDNTGQSGSPTTCDGSGPHITLCADTPPNTPPSFPADLQKQVSDFGVLAGNTVTAGQGGVATVSFPVKYVDGGGLGAKDLGLTASTTLPGGSATPGATSMQVQPGGTHTMNVNVAVPAAAALGDYKVTLTASNGSPAVTRSNTGTLTVSDQVAPSIRISTPPNGSTFTFGQSVAADYGCTDQTNASGVKSCVGPVANGARFNTRSLGSKQFTVNASDNAGNTSASTTTYRVRPRPAPPISMPFSFARLVPKTALTFLQVKSIPKGSTLTVRCKGKGCPVRKRFRKRNAKKNVTLRTFFPKSYPAGTTIEARVSKTGSVTAIRRTIFRKAKRPISAKLCLPPGAKKPRKC